MGVYAEPAQVQKFTQVEAVKLLATDVLDEMYIKPAEEILKQAFRLEVNTDGEPWAWVGTFDIRSELRTGYWNDCRRAVIMIVDRLALNPHGFTTQESGGISVSYGPMVSEGARALMAKWGKTCRVVRT